ncbi:hypothetical protein [Frigoribacterium sp. CG_9.8]|uniref:hypothetical protein n=1 Tax=Frigoribacterium sp. CG_9.8 TaxID=2787733 RepID=UPI0018CA6159|nr:hypothetical protein [Frigoribacterium sp. CG_9.8]MBG6106563.1 hypothetical protein [Frigoribacterium sp. CG_9.8]
MKNSRPAPEPAAMPELPEGQFFRVYHHLGEQPMIQLRTKTWCGSRWISDSYGIIQTTDPCNLYWVPSEAEVIAAAHHLMERRAYLRKQKVAAKVRFGDYPPKKIRYSA